MLDIKITNAKTRKTGKELVEIGIENGKITAIAPSAEGEAKQVIDAKGKLVTESFVNGHLHLCKVYTLEMAGQDALKEYNDNNMGGTMTSDQQILRPAMMKNGSLKMSARPAIWLLNMAIPISVHLHSLEQQSKTGRRESCYPRKRGI